MACWLVVVMSYAHAQWSREYQIVNAQTIQVQGQISVNEVNQPWDKVFNATLRQNNLKMIRRGEHLWIEPRSTK